ncbi:MAG: HAMP domain-containing histidine kinase [Oscillibacter sp.]|nr:HAMP domain-containing histidine kinase [Oscillibacter sp.]
MKDEEKKLSCFLENLAAELRNQLGNLYLSGRRLASTDARKTSANTDRNSAYADQSRIRLMRLVRNLEEGAALLKEDTFTRESCDIVGLVSDICEESADLAEYLGLELSFTCVEGWHICSVNPEHIRSLVYNLLSNAMKHTPKGGYVRVVLHFQREPQQVVLFVEDNGDGIPEEELPMLFDWSWSARGTTAGRHGMGLGLAICKRVAEMHGGTLSVETKASLGSRFTLCMPDEKSKTVVFRQSVPSERNGGIHPSLLMLSDALPWEAFRIKNQF